METQIPQPTPATPPPQPPPPPKNNSGILIGILVFILGIAVGLVIDKTTLLSGLRIPYLSVTPTPFASPEPTAEAGDPTASWKIYTNSTYGFSFKYPTAWGNNGLVSSPINGDPTFIGTWSDPTTIAEGTDAPFDGFSIYTADLKTLTFDDYIAKEKTDREKAAEPILDRPAPATLNPRIIANQQAISITGPSFPNTTMYFVPNPDKKSLVVISRVKKSETFLKTFDQILSTFKFTPANCTGKCPQLMPPAPDFCTNGTIISGGTNACGCSLGPECKIFTCPPSGWADCMPSPNSREKCTEEEMNWYKANCPDFKGGAY